MRLTGGHPNINPSWPSAGGRDTTFPISRAGHPCSSSGSVQRPRRTPTQLEGAGASQEDGRSLAPRPSPLAGGLHGVCMALLSPRGCPTQDASSRSLDLLDLDLCPGCKSSHHGWVVPWNGSQLVRGPLDYDFGDLQLQRWRGRAQEAPRRDALRAVRSTSAFGGQAPKTPQAPPSRLLCAPRTAAGSFPS